MPPRLGFALLLAWICTAVSASGQTHVDPRGRSILFIRGAHATGGATEGGTPAQRTEQLSDIYNHATNPRNHRYGELRLLLVKDGFAPTQSIESSTPLSLAQLVKHRVLVFGSNNKVYTAAAIRAFRAYIDRGGSALFISDANWGLTWEAAPASDKQFLGRYGAQVYQDSGQLPTMARASSGRYRLPGHPLLSGPDGRGKRSDVDYYSGEGVSLFRITSPPGVHRAVRVVSATGLLVRLNTTTGRARATRPATALEASMIVVEKSASRVVGHFDRNTFFNLNGAGTDIHGLHNAQLALNLFGFLASVPATSTVIGIGCGKAGSPRFTVTRPILGGTTQFRLSGAVASIPAWLCIAAGASKPIGFGNGCITHVDFSSVEIAMTFRPDASGRWTGLAPLPGDHRLSGLLATMQVVTMVPGAPFLGTGELSNGVQLLAGYPR